MLQNAYFLAKIGADTAENEQHLPKFCQKLATTLRVAASPRVTEPAPHREPGRERAVDVDGAHGDGVLSKAFLLTSAYACYAQMRIYL